MKIGRLFLGKYIIAEVAKKRLRRQDVAINQMFRNASISLVHRIYKLYEMQGNFRYIDGLKKIVDEHKDQGARAVYRELLIVYNELTKVVEPS